jgi:hypothetical protein
MKLFYSLILTILTTTLSLASVASTNCDCSKLLDQCGAAISPAGSDIQIRTNTKRCSQVTWYADDIAHNTVVVDGKNLEPSGFNSKPFLSVGSCKICANTHPASAKNIHTNEDSAECKKRRANLKMSEKFFAEGRITPYEYDLSKNLVKKHCSN